MKIYLSGPMKGYPLHNYPLFNATAGMLRSAGHEVYNPAEFPHNDDGTFPIRKAFAAFSKFICDDADSIILLPGWEWSTGAKAELALAQCCGLQVIHFGHLSIAPKAGRAALEEQQP